MHGTVKWFSDVKGYGFVKPDEGEVDCFVHYTAIVDASSTGFRTLAQGDRVSFDVVRSPKGLAATNVCRLDAD